MPSYIPRDRAWEFEVRIVRKDPDTGEPSAIPETSNVTAWLSLTHLGEPITSASVVTLARRHHDYRQVGLRQDLRPLWAGVLAKEDVTEALEDIADGTDIFEVWDVDGERDGPRDTSGNPSPLLVQP